MSDIYKSQLSIDRLDELLSLSNQGIENQNFIGFKFIEIEILIYLISLHSIETIIKSEDNGAKKILESIHKLNNNTYFFELIKQSYEYNLISQFSLFEKTDILVIKKILRNLSYFTESDIANIQDWQSLETIRRKRKNIISISTIFVLVFTTLIMLVLQILFNNVSIYLLLPFIVLISFDYLRKLIKSIYPEYEPLRLDTYKVDYTDTEIAVLIPIIFSNTPDYKELQNQVMNIKSMEKNIRTKIYILADLTDRDEDISNDLYREYLSNISDIFSNLNIEAKIWIRRLQFNERDEKFMGYERKRGKIDEFIDWSRGEKTKSEIFTNAKPNKYDYVFVIDEGMDISVNAISQLYSVLEHPANKPLIIDGEILQGYGIAQAKVYNKVYGNKNKFQIMCEKLGNATLTYGDFGDFIGEISFDSNFNGKGLINTHVYIETLKGKIPENLVLSHDLLDGSKCSTIVDGYSKFFEDTPKSFNSYLLREHRWLRGDMNTLFFLFPKFDFLNHKVIFKLNNQNKIRIVLNLIRIITKLLNYLFVLLYPNILVSLVILLFLEFHTNIIGFVWSLTKLITFNHKISLKFLIYSEIRKINTFKIIYYLNFTQVFISTLDGIIRSVNRLFITKRNLLEWSTFKNTNSKLISYDNLILTFVLIVTVLFFDRTKGYLLFTIFILSLLNIFYYKTESKKEIQISNNIGESFIREIISDTWNYFSVVTNNFNTLPADNFDEKREKSNNYTSITNIGFYLLSAICVYSQGIINDELFNKIISITIKNLNELPRNKNYFYNWYDIHTFKPVYGKELSSVDTGNFHACLITVYEYLNKTELVDKEILLNKIQQIMKSISYRKFFTEFDELAVAISEDNEKTNVYYNIFASESRIASFLSVLNNDVLDRHWYFLDRSINREGILKSWTGGTFEYLLPQLFMGCIDNSIEKYSYSQYIKMLKKYKECSENIWGISESLYFDYDSNTFEYKAHGLKSVSYYSEKNNYITISPYATALSVSFDKNSSLKNLYELNKFARGKYGFYESVTYNCRNNLDRKISKKYMSHHQGMMICGLMNFLEDSFISSLFENHYGISGMRYLYGTNFTSSSN